MRMSSPIGLIPQQDICGTCITGFDIHLPDLFIGRPIDEEITKIEGAISDALPGSSGSSSDVADTMGKG